MILLISVVGLKVEKKKSTKEEIPMISRKDEDKIPQTKTPPHEKKSE